jgi:DNA-binding NarL/FixJ family response regulator
MSAAAAEETRILIADDHPVVRRGLRTMLSRVPGFTVVAEAEDGAEAVKRGAQPDVDLAILDVAMPRLTGLQAAEQLTRRRPELRVLMLSVYDNEQYFFAALRAGASGYVLKSVVDEDIVDACRTAMRGEPFFYPRAEGAVVSDYLNRLRPGAATKGVLTPRETEVVKLVAEGFSSQAIAEVLTISLKTVERHRANIRDKLGLRDRVALTKYAIRRGLIEP